MLEKLRETTADILDLFAEYYSLSEDARKTGDIEQFRYWVNRTMDLSKEYHRIKDDIYKITDWEFLYE